MTSWASTLWIVLACCACSSVAPRTGTVAVVDAVDAALDAADAVPPDADATSLAANPSTTCSVGPGAWQRIYDTAPFVDVAWMPDGRLAVLQSAAIRFYTTDGQPAGDAIDLSAEATQLSAIAAVATGGWLLRDNPWFDSSDVYDPPRILRIAADGKTLWRVDPDATFVPLSATPLADGGAWVAGAAGNAGALRRLNAAGQPVQTLAWPEVVRAHAVVPRADGSVCAAGETKTPPTPGDQLVLRCWSPAGVPFWTWQQPVAKLGLSVWLGAWPDGRLLALLRSGDYSGDTGTAFATDPPATVTTTFATASFYCCGNQNHGEGDDLVAVLPAADGGLTLVREVGSDSGMSYAKIASKTVVERYAPSGQMAGSAVLNDFAYYDDMTRHSEAGVWTVARAALRLPDGGTLVVGEAPHDRFFEEPGKGWMYRLPALSCP